MKRPILISILISITCYLHGQIDPQYSHTMFNTMTVNPGYAGSNDMLCMNLLARNQWLGFDGAPTYQNFSVNAPFTLFEKEHGVGFGLGRNTFAKNVSTSFNAKLSYAYRSKMKIGDGRLGIGISLGVVNMGFDMSKAKLEVEDPNITSKKDSKTIFDLGLGVYYHTDKLYFGVSATHLPVSEYKVENLNMQMPVSTNYYLTAGYTIPLSNPMYELKPSFFIQNDGATTSMNFNSNIVYNNRVWGGLTYRAGSAFTAMFGMEFLAGVKFGIAYDYDTNSMTSSGISSGTVEAVVTYCFKLKKEKIPQKYKSIRFL